MLAAPPRIDGDVVGLAAARQSLRDQVARMERELSATLAQTYPFLAVPLAIEHQGPRLLGLEELERTRDALADRLSETRTRAQLQRAVQVRARVRLDTMLADPAAHPQARVTNEELGLPGCTRYDVVPRFGLLGALAKWWRVKVSSGCP